MKTRSTARWHFLLGLLALSVLSLTCSREPSAKALLGDIAETYKGIQSCVLEYSIATEASGQTSGIRGTVYAKHGKLRYEEEVTSPNDTLRQIRVFDGKTFCQILPDLGVVRGSDLEPGGEEANARMVEKRGALGSVLPIPDEQWNVRGKVKVQGEGTDRRFLIEASPPGASEGVIVSYKFFVEPESKLIREIEFTSEDRLPQGAVKTLNRAAYWDYDLEAEVLDTMFVVKTD